MSDIRSREEEILERARQRGRLALVGAFVRLSGPGWLGSAFTLGAGSLAGSLFLGVIGGYSLLWVQPLAMLLGIVMLAAISYVTLSLEGSPFVAIRRRINPVLAWSWLLGALLCNMVWSLPQYSLAYGAITHNLFPGLITDADNQAIRLLVSIAILVVVAALTFGYGGKSRGVRVYELVLKVLVAVIVLSFLGVVIRLTMSDQLHWSEIASGFIPHWRHLVEPAGRFPEILSTIQSADARAYWTNVVLETQRERMIAAASSTVAVNMCFLVPFSLLARKWNRAFRGLALFDLISGTLLPFILATGCVVIAAASQFHSQSDDAIRFQKDGQIAVAEPLTNPQVVRILKQRVTELEATLAARTQAAGLQNIAIEPGERQVALMLANRDNYELAASLTGLFGDSLFGQKVFGIGVLAMALSTISILMLISGFAVCEAFEVEHRGWPLRLGTLCPAVGILWPFILTGKSGAYLAVTAAVVGFTLLPLAYVTFFLIMNSRRLLGDELPRGIRRVVWNVAMTAALVISGGASAWTAWHKTLAGVPVGRIALATFIVLIVLGHVWMKRHERN